MLTFDRNWKGGIARTRIQYDSPNRYTLGGKYESTGKVYAVIVYHTKAGEIDVDLYLNGKRVRENAKRDIRYLARKRYCDLFRLTLGQSGQRYVPDLSPDSIRRAMLTRELI